MSFLKVKRREIKVPQLGDLRERISIYKRTESPPAFDEVEFTHTLTLVKTVWGSIEQNNGYELFDGVNQKETSTHFFQFRYFSDFFSQGPEIITHNSMNYKIMPFDTGNERDRFLFVPCIILGDSSLEANT